MEKFALKLKRKDTYYLKYKAESQKSKAKCYKKLGANYINVEKN
ncbi:hypothetical protein Ple7327_3440 [Pleurocapsa sp. PCC 7327]|nr:hypothetical protein Ple7327_3440 [Pleurocapsa sp. PCC 7327]